MTEKWFVLLLLRTVSMIQQEIPLRIVKISETITLRCPRNTGTRFVYWYKQSPGCLLQQVATSTYKRPALQGEFNNPHFIVNSSDTDFNLTIRNINQDDEATYFCGEGATFSMTFKEGTYVVVNDYDHERKVHQTLVPVSGSVPLGNPVTLQCSVLSRREDGAPCSGERKVFWFRSNEAHPGMVSATWNRSRGCDNRTEAGWGPQRCVYSLYKDSVLYSDAGMYYCAVAACGEMLFGNGTKLDIIQKTDPLVIALGLLSACCVIVIVILICTRNQKCVCEYCQGTLNSSSHLEHEQPAVSGLSSNDLDGNDANEDVNYAALDFPARKAEAKKKTKREFHSESIYSAVGLECQ